MASLKEKDDELVVLTFNNTQGGSNLSEFCRQHSAHQLRKFGDFGRFILEGKHFVEKTIPRPRREHGTDDEEWEMTLTDYKESRKRQSKRADAFRLLRTTSYAELEKYISQQIKDVLERDAEWEDKVLPGGERLEGVNTEKDILCAC